MDFREEVPFERIPESLYPKLFCESVSYEQPVSICSEDKTVQSVVIVSYKIYILTGKRASSNLEVINTEDPATRKVFSWELFNHTYNERYCEVLFIPPEFREKYVRLQPNELVDSNVYIERSVLTDFSCKRILGPGDSQRAGTTTHWGDVGVEGGRLSSGLHFLGLVLTPQLGQWGD